MPDEVQITTSLHNLKIETNFIAGEGTFESFRKWPMNRFFSQYLLPPNPNFLNITEIKRHSLKNDSSDPRPIPRLFINIRTLAYI